MDESASAGRKEKVTIDAAYGVERVPIYLFIPKGVAPPYQVVAFGPGLNVTNQTSSAELSGMDVVSLVVKSGRAVVYPIYKGTYERQLRITPRTGRTVIERRDLKVQMSKDLRRAIDYVETRPDFDARRAAWLGFSWGSSDGVIWSTMEPRIRTFVFVAGGLWFGQDLPEADPKNFIARNNRPVLMINGRYDYTFPLETSARHMFRLFAAPEKDKKLIVFDTGHDVSMQWDDFAREILKWLDQYLGRVK